MLDWFRRKINPRPDFKKGDWVRVQSNDDIDNMYLEPLQAYVGKVVIHEPDDWLVLIDRGTKTQYEDIKDLTKITEEEAMLWKLSN